MKRLLAALLAAPLLLTACSTATADIDPDNWETVADMQKDLDAITGECHDNVEEDDGTGYCFNGQTLLTYGVGIMQAIGVKSAAKTKDTGSEGYLVSKDAWGVYCAVAEGEDLTPARDLCTKIQDAVPGSEWEDAELADKSQSLDMLEDEEQAEESSPQAMTDDDETEPAITFEDGTHMVGSDIQPGTYRNDGTQSCYWARMSGFGGTTDDIIANDNPRGQTYVTISEDDAAFKSQLCGSWELVE